MAEKITIGIAGDPHCEILHDGVERIEKFLNASRKANADFIIHLGDFTYPNDKSKIVCPIDQMPENVLDAYRYENGRDTEAALRLYNSFEKPHYHVCGNHDFDFSSPEDVKKLFGIDNTYYSFHMGGWHFIVIDSNYMKEDDGTYTHYSRGNQYYVKYGPFENGFKFYEKIGYVPEEQLVWLKEEINSSTEPMILFAHYPLFNTYSSIKNHEKITEIINEARKNGKKVRMMISGHKHMDYHAAMNGVLCCYFNSLSNMYCGSKYAVEGRYLPEIEKEYPCLKYIFPYRNPVYYMMTIDDEGVEVKGVSSQMVPPTPRQLGVKNKEINARASTFKYTWAEIEKSAEI